MISHRAAMRLHEQNKPNAQVCMIYSIYNSYFMSVPDMTEGDHPGYCHLNIHMIEFCTVDIFTLYHSSFWYWQFCIRCKAKCTHGVSTFSVSKLPVGKMNLAFWDLKEMADFSNRYFQIKIWFHCKTNFTCDCVKVQFMVSHQLFTLWVGTIYPPQGLHKL